MSNFMGLHRDPPQGKWDSASELIRLLSDNSCRVILTILSIFAFIGVFSLLTQSYSATASEHDSIGYGDELALIENNLQAKIRVANQRSDSWVHLEQVAKAYLDRARLTGDFRDYIASEDYLKRAFDLSGGQSGPFLTRAMLNFSIHRLPDIEADLVKAESALLVDTATIATIQAIRADVLLYSGHYALAKQAYDRLESSSPSVSSASRLGHYHASIGDYRVADQWFAEAEQRVKRASSHLRSWLKLQRGILDLERGQLDDALAHYEEGLAIFPDFWLLEEHIAEVDVLQGRDTTAEVTYRDLITRTGSPLFMTALADILTERSSSAEQAEALQWQDKAREIYQAKLERMPELISGHALGYFLQSDRERQAFELARYNHQLRPDGESTLRLIQSHAALGQTARSERLLESLLESPYRHADVYATAGVIYRFNGSMDRADRYDALAVAMNPLAVDNMDWLRTKLETAKPVGH